MQDILERSDLRVPIRTWLPAAEIEPAAMEQLEQAARHPEAVSAIAVMPDCHVGFGVTIGCVFPTLDAVVPNAVGVDIGCGICAIDTGITLDREQMGRDFWRQWVGEVNRNVPAGFSVHKQPQNLGPLDLALRATALQPLMRQKAAFQLGTLGGGNHFLEAQVDEAGTVWLMVHSGSRHLGLRIAKHYNDLAIEITRRRGLAVRNDLASLPVDDQTGQDYIADMAWATDFALSSRRQMAARLLEAFHRGLERAGLGDLLPDAPEEFINIHHNFAQLEEHGGEQVMVHRKGATSAGDGQLGIIPGSMGSKSYIVRGRGNEESFRSCSHGAGRRMSRGTARKTITESEFSASLEGTHSKASMNYVDEAPQAYKDVDEVIGRQADLVDIVHTLTPIVTVKGDSRARED
jgi:tRNA-splicing ligase RtcB